MFIQQILAEGEFSNDLATLRKRHDVGNLIFVLNVDVFIV